MSPVAFLPGCFGKLPVAADFIGHHLHDQDALALERWLQDGVGLARQKFGARSDDLLRALPVTYFIQWWSDPQAPSIGVLLPGRDRSGRLFPFTIFLQTRGAAPAGTFEAWPILFRDFLEEAVRIGAGAWREFADLTQRIDGLGEHVPSLEAGVELQKLFATAAARSLSRGDRDGLELASRTAANVRAWVPSTSDVSAGSSPIGLRFPIPTADHSGHAAACFWLELLRRSLAGSRRPPNCFWSLATGAREGSLDVYYHPADPLGFLHLLDPGFESDRLYPVEEGAPADRDRGAGPSTGALAPELSLRDALKLLVPAE